MKIAFMYPLKFKLLIVVGTRPNFIKVTQFKNEAIQFPGLEIRIVHTGQHYDDKMSKVFFDELEMIPDFFLGVGTGSPNTQMANIMIELEKVFSEEKPDLVMVVGDVNSTAVAAITANRMNIRVAHLESGLRSFDRSMPEEINRIIADDIADFFFVTEQSGMDNLIREGKTKEKIFFVGNTMIDSMVAFETAIESSEVLNNLKLKEKKFVLMTVHRPATVDSKEGLTRLLSVTDAITKKYAVVFPVHPRTEKNIKAFGLEEKFHSNKNLIATGPLDYFSFQKLIKHCFCVITDSGGIQEETTFRQVPCLTLRPNTERPVTIEMGTNELIPFDVDFVNQKIVQIEKGTFKKGNTPPFWDGKATVRILKVLSENLK